MDLTSWERLKKPIKLDADNKVIISVFCVMLYYFVLYCIIVVLLIAWWCIMSEKMTVLNIRMSVDEKQEIKERAEKDGKTSSSYARDLLFSSDNTNDNKDNTGIIQEKDERISDLKEQIEDYKKQIDQLHTIILATQKDNQLLLEQKQKRWWQIWK